MWPIQICDDDAWGRRQGYDEWLKAHKESFKLTDREWREIMLVVDEAQRRGRLHLVRICAGFAGVLVPHKHLCGDFHEYAMLFTVLNWRDSLNPQKVYLVVVLCKCAYKSFCLRTRMSLPGVVLRFTSTSLYVYLFRQTWYVHAARFLDMGIATFHVLSGVVQVLRVCVSRGEWRSVHITWGSGCLYFTFGLCMKHNGAIWWMSP